MQLDVVSQDRKIEYLEKLIKTGNITANYVKEAVREIINETIEMHCNKEKIKSVKRLGIKYHQNNRRVMVKMDWRKNHENIYEWGKITKYYRNIYTSKDMSLKERKNHHDLILYYKQLKENGYEVSGKRKDMVQYKLYEMMEMKTLIKGLMIEWNKKELPKY